MAQPIVRKFTKYTNNSSIIYIGLGANLPHPTYGTPRQTLEVATRMLEARGLEIIARSSWYQSAPVPLTDQPWYVNGVIAVRSDLTATAVMCLLHAVESEFGRQRTVVNAPRVIDLDLLDYQGQSRNGVDGGPVLPHPRMTGRKFVLLPLQEIAPDWRDPVSGQPIADLVQRLPADQITQLLK